MTLKHYPANAKRYWNKLAKTLARDAGANAANSRCGVWFIKDEGVLCAYVAVPFNGTISGNAEVLKTNRAVVMEQVVRDLKAAGMRKLAAATYVEPNGYGHVAILDAGEDRATFVADAVRDYACD